MVAVTALVAVIGSLLALGKKPERALSVYMVCLFVYPLPLVIPLGPADFNVPRIVVIALLIGATLRGRLKHFRFHLLDLFIVLELVGRLISLSQNVEPSLFMVREAGWFFDTGLPYFAARLILTSREALFRFLKTFIYLAIPLAPFGVIEAVTGFNVTELFGSYYAWDAGYVVSGFQEKRLGFYRASFTFGVHIVWGLFFAAVAPMCVGLFKTVSLKERPIIALGFIMAVAGLMSSLSTAPLYAFVVSMAMIAVFKFRQYWPPMAAAVIMMIIILEIYIDGHFYEIGTTLAFESATASYRIALLNEAFGGGMDGHWLFGYGYVGIGPGNDNTNFDWFFKDLLNIYVGKLARVGLVGLLPFIAANILYYRRLYQAAKATRDPNMWWLIWCISAFLVGWNVAMMTVGALGKIETMLYLMIGMCSNLPSIVAEPATQRVEVPQESSVRRRVPWRRPRQSLTPVPRPSHREVLAAQRPFRRPYRRPGMEGQNV